MARKATGQVVERKRKRGRVFALRFRAGGERQYVTLPDGMTREEAERELRHVLADVERGTWRPPEPAPEVELPEREPTFHEFASEWWEDKKRELRANTRLDYEWRLTVHLLPHFQHHRLSEITVQEVDRYRQAKVREARLSAESINKTLVLLAQVLEVAVEYELLDRNPAVGKRRRLRAPTPRRSYLDTAEQIAALLEAAGELDGEAHPATRHVHRRAMLATLTFAGLRLGELLSLRWRDVDLAAGRLRVGESKTDAGRRDVRLLLALRDVLADLKARSTKSPDALVFATSEGHRFGASNVRRRVLAKAVERANVRLGEAELPPLPVGLTPHSLRRTYCSRLYALGQSPPEVMAEMGHTDPKLVLSIYAHAMRRDEGEGERLRSLVEGFIGHQWAPAPSQWSQSRQRAMHRTPQIPMSAGVPTMGAAGIEPATSRV
jgi:integrase